MKKYAYDSYKSLIVINKNLTKEFFLNKAGAESGYAKDIFSRIYDSIFTEAEIVDVVFLEYYKEEYNDIETYLYCKYCIDMDDVKEIMELKNSNTDYVIYDFAELNYGNSNIVEFAFSDDMYERITDMLLMK